LESSDVEALKSELSTILNDGSLFFSSVDLAGMKEREAKIFQWRGINPYWDALTNEEKLRAQQIKKRLTDIGPRLIAAAQVSPLLEQTDIVEIRRLLRTLCSALVLKEYTYLDSYVVSQEDSVFGIEPASQEDVYGPLHECAEFFGYAAQKLSEKTDFLAPSPENLTRAIVSSQTPSIKKYRPNTAFIMMQINEKYPELEDVKNCIKDVFKEFGIKAVRSDEIEHSGTITQRVLDEIATSQFLIADLTGERPSVYYEVGFAHAIGTNPILYRKKGSPLHFDLAVHNVPEYENITDLKTKLKVRVAFLTNREPKASG